MRWLRFAPVSVWIVCCGGSDWPHTQFESQIKYAAMRAQLDTWLPNAADRKVVLAEAPRGLFRLG
jgi:predicted TIM-barrel fold metal-dependent hydrolase